MGTAAVLERRNPGCLVQLLWFIFVGIWLGEIWIVAAWLLMLSVIGIPLGVIMFNNLPFIIALRQPDRMVLQNIGGRTVPSPLPQHPLLLRIVYFVLIGWWLSFLWVEVAYAICVTYIGLPVGLWMIDRVPALLTLHRG
jgi:uncharacterized membrane protein YccF (DUF307 family)